MQMFCSDHEIVVLGGSNDYQLDLVEKYDTGAGWSTLPKLSSSR